jgi:hypothetical protein
MSGFYVRDKYLFQRSRNQKWNGIENQIPGKVFYVVPNTAYTSAFTDRGGRIAAAAASTSSSHFRLTSHFKFHLP